MKKLLTLMTVALMTIGGYAQCKYSKDTDTHKAIKNIWIQGDMGGGAGIGFSKINDTYFLNWKRSVTSSLSMFTSEGDELILILDNGESMTLKCATATKTKITANTSIIEPDYIITADQLKMLSEHTITNFKFKTMDTYQESKSNKKKGLEKVKVAAGCIAQ